MMVPKSQNEPRWCRWNGLTNRRFLHSKITGVTIKLPIRSPRYQTRWVDWEFGHSIVWLSGRMVTPLSELIETTARIMPMKIQTPRIRLNDPRNLTRWSQADPA